MPRRMTNPKRVVGYQPGNLCPYCGKQVKEATFAVGETAGVMVAHTWYTMPCVYTTIHSDVIQQLANLEPENEGV